MSLSRENGICIHGCSEDCTTDMLEAAFGGFGTIVDTFIKARRGRGFAFVTFDNTASVAAAIAGAPATIGDDEVTVEARTPPRERQVADPCENIYIKGLDAGTTEEQVSDAVAGFGAVASLEVVADRGFAFVSFETTDEAQAAVWATPILVGGVMTDVEFRLSKPRGARGGGGGGGGRSGRRSRKRSAREPNSVYLKGVPGDVSDDAITAALAGFGNCISVAHRAGRDFAFAAFEGADGMDAAVAAGSCRVDGADVLIEERTGGALAN